LCGLTLGIREVRWACDNGVLDFLSKEIGCSLLHLQEYHGADLLWGEPLRLTFVLYLNDRLVVTVTNDFEREMLDIVLYLEV
jgi:hypothetical protein